MKTNYTYLESPLGRLLLTSDGAALTRLYMNTQDYDAAGKPGWTEDAEDPVLREAAHQLAEYFDGARTAFDLPLAAAGTEFQARVWRELGGIGYGETLSYGEVARRIGSPGASRAVGLANGSNPISIVVPCHRVIGANGKLTGYGGGLPRKAMLLDFERAVRAGRPRPLEAGELDLFAGAQS